MSDKFIAALVVFALVWIVSAVFAMSVFWDCIREAKSKKEVYTYICLLLFTFVAGPAAWVVFYGIKYAKDIRARLRELE